MVYILVHFLWENVTHQLKIWIFIEFGCKIPIAFEKALWWKFLRMRIQQRYIIIANARKISRCCHTNAKDLNPQNQLDVLHLVAVITTVSFSVVNQYYEAEVVSEYVIKGNTAVLKCNIPSFVTDFVKVEAWLSSDGEEYLPRPNFGTCSFLLGWLYLLNLSLNLKPDKLYAPLDSKLPTWYLSLSYILLQRQFLKVFLVCSSV